MCINKCLFFRTIQQWSVFRVVIYHYHFILFRLLKNINFSFTGGESTTMKFFLDTPFLEALQAWRGTMKPRINNICIF